MGPEVGIILFMVLAPLLVAAGIRIIGEHEQGVRMRFGRFLAVHGPGLQIVLPFVDEIRKIDLRELAVVEPIEPDSQRGQVQFWGEPWPAKSADGTAIATGTPIEVFALDGRYVVVRRIRG